MTMPDFNALNPRRDLPPIIGLSGYARSGKDTVGSILQSLYGYQQDSFASTIKDGMYRLNPMVPVGPRSTRTIRELVDMYGWDNTKEIDHKHPQSPRALLQRFGTEVGRDMFGENFWVDQTLRRFRRGGFVPTVITDVRFINEANAITNEGGIVVRIERPGVEAANTHASETGLDDWLFEHVITNDGSLTDLQGEVMALMGDLG